jgi:CheY-like chemotaxis protein
MAKILVVEDDESNRDMICRRLVRAGYEVVSADDGAEGVRLVGEARPDLVLMDLALGAMDGWEATRLIRSDPTTSATPVIVLTVHALESDRRRSFEAGCNDFETKPIELHRLLGKIQRQLSAAT